jgi:hypothetical protein
VGARVRAKGQSVMIHPAHTPCHAMQKMDGNAGALTKGHHLVAGGAGLLNLWIGCMLPKTPSHRTKILLLTWYSSIGGLSYPRSCSWQGANPNSEWVARLQGVFALRTFACGTPPGRGNFCMWSFLISLTLKLSLPSNSGTEL